MTKKDFTEDVVRELVGEEALPIVEYLKGKKQVSEFIISEELDLEIHKTRNLLYRLFEHHIVTFIRKKDKKKGWYICYWDFNPENLHHLKSKILQAQRKKIEERLEREKKHIFYMCTNACIRMDFENAIEFNFFCPECGEIMNQQSNERTIEFLTQKIEELDKEIQKNKK